MKTLEQSETSWGIGYYAEGAKDSTGPVGEDRIRLDAARSEVMRKLNESFANRALNLVSNEDDKPTVESDKV